MVSRKTKRVSENVTKIKNEYVRTLQQKENLRRAKKVRLYRRLAVFAVIAMISFGVLANIFISQKKVLAVKAEEKEAMLVELAAKEEEHLALTKQLEKLNDDDYLAKLARQEYFLSDEHEIIFSIPEKDEKVKKKNEEKE